ncbi:MAG: hypothetical protein EOO38_16320 [Cytophagaceae bacterium]|nr:MAG: hypothetical protein EOO38_16320 [Cytophagaceae bacterium]
MKPTTRNSIERRLEAMETKQATQAQTPELRLILDKGGGTEEVHILGKGGKFIVPAKMTLEQWAARAQANR